MFCLQLKERFLWCHLNEQPVSHFAFLSEQINVFQLIEKLQIQQCFYPIKRLLVSVMSVYIRLQCAALSRGALTPRGVCVNGAEWTQRSTLHQLFASAQCTNSFGFETLVKEVIFLFSLSTSQKLNFLLLTDKSK